MNFRGGMSPPDGMAAGRRASGEPAAAEMETAEKVAAVTDPGEAGRAEHNRGDRASVRISNVFAWIFPLLMIAIVLQVVLRTSGFNQAWLDDLQWWLYGSSALAAIAYAVTTNSHVRVDIFHANFPPERRHRIEVFALVWLLLPFVILSWDITLPYALQSFANDEGSDSPNGLHNLWILKIFMNVAFVIIGAAVWSAYVRFLSKLTRPVLWKQLFFAFPSTVYLVNLVCYYAIWWWMRLTSPPELTNREIGRLSVFGHFNIGPEEVKWTILFAVIGTFFLILAARAIDRAGRV